MKLSNNQLLLLAAFVIGIGYVLYSCKSKKGVRETFLDVGLMQNPQLTYFQSPSAYPIGNGAQHRSGQPLKYGGIVGPGAPLQYQGVMPMGQGTNRMNPNQCSGYAEMVHESGQSVAEMEAEIHAKLAKKLQLPNTADLLPEMDGDCPFAMAGEFDPTDAKNFLAPRNIFALRKGRYQADNDMIRGSLRIAPTQSDLFNTSPQPVNDLVVGALQIGAIGADMPTMLEGEGMFASNLRLQNGLNRLDFISGEHCSN